MTLIYNLQRLKIFSKVFASIFLKTCKLDLFIVFQDIKKLLLGN